jgi:hypothetical protein
MTSDPGLQPQRTALAWQRTGVAVLLTCAATSFAALRHNLPALSAGAILSSAAVCHLGFRHFPKGANRRVGVDSMWSTMVATAGLAVIAALVGCALAFSEI